MELKQTKEWEVYSNRFRHLYETLLPENVGKYYRKRPTGQTYSEIKLLIEQNNKPQALTVYPDGLVTKDHPG